MRKEWNELKHVFIVGSKGIPANYGGFETFVDKLTEYHQNETDLRYHVACRSTDCNDSFVYHNADCFRVKVPNLGAAQAIWYDVAALFRVCNYIEKNKIPNPTVYILACRIGIFAPYFQKRIHRLGGTLYLNPDGHEWKRAKWPLPVRMYWKLSEAIMVNSADLIVCDSVNIEEYIRKTYHKTADQTTFIPYGAEVGTSDSPEADAKLEAWLSEKGLSHNNYYLSVGRFVPENNYETMIREFMASNSSRDYAIITTPDDAFARKLEEKLHYLADPRIKFVGTVYDQELLRKIREDAYAYIHGHEVGGTNPSLLEALASTKLSLLFDVSFNREVGINAVFYWTKVAGCLSRLIDNADSMSNTEIENYAARSSQVIHDRYSWQLIADEYKKIW